MAPSIHEVLGTALFGISVLHTFAVKYFNQLARRFPQGSICENIFHLLGEIEIVFGFWAGIFIFCLGFIDGLPKTMTFVNQTEFTEPLFVFAVMTVCSTKPIKDFGFSLINKLSSILPFPPLVSAYYTTLFVGPLLGSLITEPAAMTVTAIILKDRFYCLGLSRKTMYVTLAALFVNISIGGVLTPFAAPPVVMVARPWNWDLSFVFHAFGWKAILAVLINTSLATYLCSKELKKFAKTKLTLKSKSPTWLQLIHLIFLGLIVASSHYSAFFIGILLFFLGLTLVTQEHQEEVNLRQSLLVGFFLGGLVIFGSSQKWWLEPLIQGLNSGTLFLTATFLTAFTDNAALTFLGSKIPDMTDTLKYALVSGAVAGGGLTVIANAPNPGGFAILQEHFGKEGISPIQLFLYALIPTFIAMACLWFL